MHHLHVRATERRLIPIPIEIRNPDPGPILNNAAGIKESIVRSIPGKRNDSIGLVLDSHESMWIGWTLNLQHPSCLGWHGVFGRPWFHAQHERAIKPVGEADLLKSS